MQKIYTTFASSALRVISSLNVTVTVVFTSRMPQVIQ